MGVFVGVGVSGWWVGKVRGYESMEGPLTCH
jgi:hypothetical protein